MTKTDLIKFRCTPAFKARVQREAAYRGATVSELVEDALDAYLPQAGAPAVQTAPPLVEPPAPTPYRQIVRTPFAYTTTPAPEPPACPHGRPSRKVCWECA